jgi:hypothetical protein
MTNAASRWLQTTYQPTRKELRFRRIAPFIFTAIGAGVAVVALALGGVWSSTGIQVAVVSITFGIFTAGKVPGWSFLIGFVGFLVPMLLLFLVCIPCVSNGEPIPQSVDLINGAASILLICMSVFGPGQKHVYQGHTFTAGSTPTATPSS